MGVAGTGTTPSYQYYQISGGSTGASNYYDTNGNLKNDVTHTYTWDADGNMLSTDGSTVTMMYDALDRMIEQTRGSSHAEIVYGPYGLKLALMNGQTLVNAFVKLPGGSRAVYNSSGLAYYRHGDHLGSSRLATTTTRTKYYDVAYAPYGEDYNGSGATADLAFTDQNQDTVGGGWATNLYDFMLREYRTAHGRWTSPDPAGLGAVDPTNPQTWNRYAYVLNNPLVFIDPLGLVPPCTVDPNDGIPCFTIQANGCPVGEEYTNVGSSKFCVPQGMAQIINQILSGQLQCPPGQICYGQSNSGGGSGSGSGGGAANNGQECDNACQLAQAINKTGVQTLRNPCTIGGFYAASTTVVAIPVATVSSLAGVGTGVTVTGIGAAEAGGGAAAVEAGAGYFPGLLEASKTVSGWFAAGGAVATSAWDWVKQKVSAGCNANINW